MFTLRYIIFDGRRCLVVKSDRVLICINTYYTGGIRIDGPMSELMDGFIIDSDANAFRALSDPRREPSS